MADALEHLVAGVLAAGVLQAVGDDHEDHLAGALGSRHRGQARAELVDRAADRIEQRRAGIEQCKIDGAGAGSLWSWIALSQPDPACPAAPVRAQDFEER